MKVMSNRPSAAILYMCVMFSRELIYLMYKISATVFLEKPLLFIINMLVLVEQIQIR